MRIAYQGEPGAYSEAAALHFSDHADLIACEAFDDVFTRSAPGGRRTASCRSRTRLAAASTATTTCSWSMTCRLWARWNCPSGITCWPSRARRSTRCSAIYSHPQALAQCERFLKGMRTGADRATYDTAGSAKLIKEQALDRCGGHRVGARRAGVRPRHAAVGHPGLLATTSPGSWSSPAAAIPRHLPIRRRSCSPRATSRARSSRR